MNSVSSLLQICYRSPGSDGQIFPILQENALMSSTLQLPQPLKDQFQAYLDSINSPLHKRSGVDAGGPIPDTFSLTPFASGGIFYFYQLDSQTVVIKMIDFDGTDMADSQVAFDAGMNKVKQLGLTKLVMDMTDNKGGQLCFMYSVMLYFFPTGSLLPVDRMCNGFTYAMSKAALSLKQSNNAWHPNGYKDLSKNVLTNTNYFNPTNCVASPNTEGLYTKQLYYNCNYKPFSNVTYSFSRSNIAIYTNSMCASSCAIAIKVPRKFNTETFSYGVAPFMNQLLNLGRAAGGSMYTLTQFVNDVTSLKINTGSFDSFEVPTRLPYNGELSFTLFESFHGTVSTVPIEFRLLQVDKNMQPYLGYVYDPSLAWNYIASKLPSG
jgi:hypothetical protein